MHIRPIVYYKFVLVEGLKSLYNGPVWLSLNKYWVGLNHLRDILSTKSCFDFSKSNLPQAIVSAVLPLAEQQKETAAPSKV